MFVPLIVKTDNSLLHSLIKTNDLIDYLKEHNINACGICDNKMYGVVDFYTKCIDNNIKPIIGLDVILNDLHIYLYAMNYDGYKELLKINTIIEERNLAIIDLKNINNILCIIPYESINIFNDLTFIKELYVSYKTEIEKKNALIITSNVVYANEILAFTNEDTKYLNYLRKIDNDLNKYDYTYNYFIEPDNDDTNNVADKLNVTIPFNNRYIPHYDNEMEDSYSYLINLTKKGLLKRLNNKLEDKYVDRLKYELDVINKMGFVDYFLIVYDYVKYAKQHNILVGPGRGSAAGSLVSYVLGITNIDPIKYDLLFERFLNPERITMPDIDIDFEYTKRDLVINYIREKYGNKYVGTILTFSTLSSRQVIKDIGKILDIDNNLIDRLTNMFNPKLSLKENYENNTIKEFILHSNELKKIFKIALKLEGLKRQTSTHAAGVVISSIELDDIIPIIINNNEVQTGIPMEHLESLGLLKMDFLALKNLTIIENVLELIKNNLNVDIDLNNIPLDDKNTLKLFYDVNTTGIFQFESSGMKNFLRKLHVNSFEDLIAAIALFRPGPMENIDTYIKRKEGKENIDYIDDSLKDILSDTYGIMIYQEQIMQVLVKMASYTFSEADNIRRAMSKKKIDVMEKERDKFITASINNGYEETIAKKAYETIYAFANYGFNKSHSVAYALIGYQMAYLKANYPDYFMANLLNMSIGSDIKTKEYIVEAKKIDLLIQKPSINLSVDNYLINNKKLLLPLNSIKGIGQESVKEIINERKNKEYEDFFDFVSRTYGKSVNRKTIECLIDGGVFDEFNYNHNTLFNNIDSAITYAELRSNLDESLVMKPIMEEKEEFSDSELMSRELNVYNFYVTNHPSSKYQGDDIVKIDKIKNFFDKFVKTIVIINSVHKIKTKKNEDMAFMTCSDETNEFDYVLFPKKIHLLNNIKKDDLVKITGQVTRRLDKYQIVVSNIEKI